MNLPSWLKKLITGSVIFETTSPINGKIQVVEDFFGKRLVVEGLTQSGGQVERIWKKAIKEIINYQLSIINCLILGLGAGTLARFVSQKWPGAKTTGIEIDPEIIKIGKKYFSLDKIFNLKVVLSDAADFVSQFSIFNLRPELRSRDFQFSIIFIDLYLSDQVPPQCESVGFLKKLKKLLAPNGLLVFNRLYYKDHKQKTEEFLDKLEKIFQTIKRKKVGGNLLVFVQS